jgi:hypothetical protein
VLSRREQKGERSVSGSFSRFERLLSLLAGAFNLVVGLLFFFHLAGTIGLWPKDTEPSPVLSHFIGAIVLGNAIEAFLLAREHEWVRVRPLVVVAIVYGALVGTGLLYDAFQPYFNPFFWGYLAFDLGFEVVFVAIFLSHERLAPLGRRQPTPAASPSADEPSTLKTP